MREYRRIVSSVERSPLFQSIESGLEPSQLKEYIIETLRSYFDNFDTLERLAIVALVPEYIILLRLQKDKWILKMFNNCLASHKLAKKTNPAESFKACARWEHCLMKSLSEYWSLVNLEIDTSKLKLEDFAHGCFEKIGSLLESIMKPYLKALLHQIYISMKKTTTYSAIGCKDFGSVVKELIKNCGYPELFMPPPWNIRLNQWRNIALHFDYEIKGGVIICRYGKDSNSKIISLSRKGLMKLTHLIFSIFYAIKLARTLYMVDNINEITKFGLPQKQREEANFLNFAAGLASQGFRIIDYRFKKQKSRIIIQDVSKMDPNKRRVHASQFVFPLWEITKSSCVEIEYREKNGIQNFLISASMDACEKLERGEIEFSSLANLIGMKDLKTGKMIPALR